MLAAADVVYQYDGSYDGFLCCVYVSYIRHELPLDIVPDDSVQEVLLGRREIITVSEQARRVERGIVNKIGREAAQLLRLTFLSELAQRELLMLRFLCRGFGEGERIMRQCFAPELQVLRKAVQKLTREAHLYKEFVRFSDYGGMLAAQIEPKNHVLPLLKRHFTDRLPQENFIIHDKTHGAALVHEAAGRSAVIALNRLELAAAGAEESSYRRLWRMFYDTVEIKLRHNERCRMNFMPKRYWKFMTEFSADTAAASAVAPAAMASPAAEQALPPGKRG